MDLYESTDKNLMTATFELPGLSKDNVQIDVEGGNLAVSGECTILSEQQEQGYAIKERRSGKFVRSVRLPEGTQVSNESLKPFRWEMGLTRLSSVSAAEGCQGLDGERHLDRHLSQVHSWPGGQAHRHCVKGF